MRTSWAVSVLIAILFMTAVAAAQPSPSAELLTRDVHTNFMESFSATVRNQGSEDMTVLRVSVTIDWPGWAPTLYPIFDGRLIVAAGQEMTFEGPAIRMPQTDAGDYHAFLAVVIETPQGQQEMRYETSVGISDWSVQPGGVPEYIAVPVSLAAIMLLVTAFFFRLERARGWPPLQAVPRFHRRRRT